MKDRPKPLKRHLRLQPLSRAHHYGLILAQVLKKDVPDYKSAPTTPEGKVEYVQGFFKHKWDDHLQKEEEILIPAVKGYDHVIDQMAGQLLEEHQLIRQMVTTLPDYQGQELVDHLDALGRLMESHIRFEERSFFMEIQKVVPKEIIEGLDLE